MPEHERPFTQWRPPTEEQVYDEQERADKIFDSLCTELSKRRKYLQRLKMFSGSSHCGSIELEVSSNLLVESRFITEADAKVEDPHETSILSFAFYRDMDAVEAAVEAEKANQKLDVDGSIYELGTSFILPASFGSLPRPILLEVLDHIDPDYNPEASDEDLADAIEFFDHPKTPFEIYQKLHVVYTIDPYEQDLQHTYDIAYDVIHDGMHVVNINTASYATTEEDPRLESIEMAAFSEQSSVDDDEYDPVADDEELLPKEMLSVDEHTLGVTALKNMVETENTLGVGIKGGLSDSQMYERLLRLVKILPR